MAENLGKRPSKGILKTTSSFDNQETACRASKETKWDEMNIIATLHPPDKDYGHMKIEEPKTPYNFAHNEDVEELDSSAVASKLNTNVQPKIFDESSEEEEEVESPEERERRIAFEAKRKTHYREWDAVQLARKKLLEEEEDEDSDEDGKQKSDDDRKTDDDIDDDENKDSNSQSTQTNMNFTRCRKQVGSSKKRGCCSCMQKNKN